MLKPENVLFWNEIEHDLYEEDGLYTDLANLEDNIYDAIESFNSIVKEDKE